MDCKSIYEGLIPSALSNNPTTMEIAMDKWKYIVWVGGVDNYYTTYDKAMDAYKIWKELGYTDVIIEKIEEIAMSCQDNDRIYEDLNEKIGNYTVNQFINICETYKIQGAVNQIDSIIGELIDIKMENECE